MASARRLPPVGRASALRAVGRMLAAILAYQAALIGASILLFFFALSAVPAPAQGIFGLGALGLAEGLALLAVLAVWHWLDRRPLKQLGLNRYAAPRRWLRGAGVAAVLMGLVVFGWYSLLAGAPWAVNPSPARASVVVVGGLLGYALQGPAEEVLFRGHLLENLRARWGVGWAVIVSSVLFGIFHAFNPGFGPLPLLNLVLFGVATALYKLRIDRGQLWGVFGIHTVWNWLQQVVFGLPNSGMIISSDNALFTVTPDTALPDPISGGGFGPEGTLATTLVLLALIGLTLRHSSPRLPARWRLQRDL